MNFLYSRNLCLACIIAITAISPEQVRSGGIGDFGKRLDPTNKNSDVRKGANDLGRQIDQARRDAEAQAREFDRRRLQAQQDLQRRFDEARRQVREATTFSSNKAQVKASLHSNGWRVAFGKEIDHREEYNFYQAVSASIATDNPGPVMAYIEYIVIETKREILQNLEREGGSQARELEMELVRALERAIKTGQVTEFSFR